MRRLMVAMILAVCGATDSTLADKTLEYRSRVARVVDGDTLIVTNRLLADGVILTGEATVELDGLDAPELDQPGGEEAKSSLECLVKDKEVLIIELTDAGKSRGAWVFVGQDKRNVNTVLIERGQAWLTEARDVSSTKSKQAYERMKEAFHTAKARRQGIWASDNPVPPWEWVRRPKSQLK